MKYQAVVAVKQLAAAHKRARQLRRAVGRLHETLPEHHETWQAAGDDIDAMLRQFEGALDAVEAVFQRDPTEYTRPPDRL
jgi:hypothetical protein